MARINWKERNWTERCPTVFERKPRKSRIVTKRWQCNRPKMKGLPYCSYCEPYSAKRERLEAKKRATTQAPVSSPDNATLK